MAALVHNLDSRRSSIRANYAGIVVYWLGDAAHQAEQSDHNPDSRGIVHAIDAMISIIAQGNEIVAWVLDDPRDVEYVIFNGTIWSRSNGFKPRAYTGSNPHTDHVHISGKHGSVGENAATGTGYDLTAEKMTPEGMSDMNSTQQYVQHVMNYRIDAIIHMRPMCNIPAFTATDGSKWPAISEVNHLAAAVLAAQGNLTPEELAALATAIANQVEAELPTVQEIADASAKATVAEIAS